MSSKHFRDGSYNPAWVMDWPTPAAVLSIGGAGTGTNMVGFDDIRLTMDKSGDWTAEADDSGRTWRGRSDSNTGAILALLADRIGLHAVVTFKPEPDADQTEEQQHG
ncbi:MAG TPA: hypothetical protein VGD91_24935 [Trebonia sp.]